MVLDVPSIRRDATSLILSFFLCLLIGVGFSTTSDRFDHWFMIPLTLCGILIGIDMIDWIRNKMDVFDPVGIIGALGFHFFFMAPLLHVYWDHWMRYVTPPDDWRLWLGYMAILNLVGLLVYRFSRQHFSRVRQTPTTHITSWRLNVNLFMPVLVGVLLITGGLQFSIYQQFGGIQGYISSFERQDNAFAGMGWVFMFSESFPILFFMGYAVYIHHKRISPHWITIIIMMVLFLVLKMLFGGLRGSRSNTIWGIFWAAGIIHFWIRPLPRQMIYGGLLFVVFFMYLYGFYKGLGSEAFELIQTSNYTELEERTGRTLEVTLLGDLGRADVQSFLLYRLVEVQDFEYAWGQTYLGDIAILIPRSLWINRPVGKVSKGTDALYGMGTYPSRVSSRVYGLAGESMLNFGPVSIPFVFFMWGWIVAGIRNRLVVWAERDDIWLLIIPLLINVCFNILTSDLDNLIFFLVKNGTLPFIVLYVSAIKGENLSDFINREHNL